MKRFALGLLFVALLLLFIVLSLCAPRSRAQWSVVNRFKLQQADNQGESDPYWFSKRMTAISNYLGQLETKRLIATKASVAEDSFEFGGTRLMRGAAIFEIRYLGNDSNTVRFVSTIATHSLHEFFRTNNPSIQFTLIDINRPSPPRAWWRRGLDSIEEAFQGSARW